MGDLLRGFDRGAAGDAQPKLDLVRARLAVHTRAEHPHLLRRELGNLPPRFS